MAKWSWQKAVNSGASWGALGAAEGQKLNKKYGKAGGGAAGTIIGFLAGGLQGTPDPNLNTDVLNDTYDKVYENIMKQARSAGRESSGEVAEIFAKRGVGGSGPASVEAHNYGRALDNAQSSLVPFRTEIDYAIAQEKSQARRVGEQEERQSWADMLESLGLTASRFADATNLDDVDSILGGGDNSKTTVPIGYSQWEGERQDMWLRSRGFEFPAEWDRMTPEGKEWSMQQQGINAKEPQGPPAKQIDMFLKDGQGEGRTDGEMQKWMQGGKSPGMPSSQDNDVLTSSDIEGIKRLSPEGNVEESKKRTDTSQRDLLPKEEQKQAQEDDGKPASKKEMDRLKAVAPDAMKVIEDNPDTPISKFLREPHTKTIMSSVITQLGDQAASVIQAYVDIHNQGKSTVRVGETELDTALTHGQPGYAAGDAAGMSKRSEPIDPREGEGDPLGATGAWGRIKGERMGEHDEAKSVLRPGVRNTGPDELGKAPIFYDSPAPKSVIEKKPFPNMERDVPGLTKEQEAQREEIRKAAERTAGRHPFESGDAAGMSRRGDIDQEGQSKVKTTVPAPPPVIEEGTPVQNTPTLKETIGETKPIIVASNLFVGLEEVKDKQRLMDFFESQGVRNNGKAIDPTATAWCTAFTGAVLSMAGYKRLDTLAAREYANYGTPGDGSVGDIAVWNNHTGIVVKMDNGQLGILGGNITNGVRIIPKSALDKQQKFIGYRKPVSR